MMPQRFMSNQITENVTEKDYIIVPSVRLFDSDKITVWITEQKNKSELAINLSLLFYKFPKWFKTLNANGHLKEINYIKEFHQKRQNKSPKKVTHDYKREHLEDIAVLSAKKPINYDAIKNRYCPTSSFAMTTKTRFLVGFSGGSVFENSISLHPLYGFPLISGSGLKGLGRHFCDEFLIPDERCDEATKIKIFGNEPGERDQDRLTEGEVVFMDAWPEDWPGNNNHTEPLLELDIINPHYSKYYKDGSTHLPSDDQNPVPIIFLAVKKGISFRFCLMPSSRCNDITIVNTAAGILQEALKIFGAGAKTGSSYGYFG